MCGIAGILYCDATRPVDANVLSAMTDAIAHRGPDAEGFWVGRGVGLGHRRLSIIDLEGGDQPMPNEDGRVRVIFNGEIYNFIELRNELLGRGHEFRTSSDTEVIVHLYEEYGVRLVERLRGMFAFALWDDARQELMLARDRIGLKPLYYYLSKDAVLFGSEIKAILAHPNIDLTLDPAALESYLAFGVIPGEQSIFQKIRKLPPAHVLSLRRPELNDGTPIQYWSINVDPGHERSLGDWIEKLEAKLHETVLAHQIADVPVGAFLSGGVDSSAIVAHMASQPGSRLRTFSVGFQEEGYSEVSYAREVASRYGTEHYEETVTADAVSGLEELVKYFDEPFADASAVPTMCVAAAASKHVKVVVSGDGGDEAFGGYTRYAHDLKESALRRFMPAWLRSHVVSRLAAHWPSLGWLPRPLRIRSALTNLALEPDHAYAHTVSIYRQPVRDRVLGKSRENGLPPESYVREGYLRGRDPLQSMTCADIGMLLPDDFLTKVDRASMSVGLEVRPPLVDHEFLELAVQAPSRYKVHRGETKWIFKQMQKHRLPLDVVWRKKQGFEMPVDDWLRGPLREQVESAIAPNGPLAGLLDLGEVRKLHQAHQRRLGRHGLQLWALLVLARWHDRYAKATNHSSSPLPLSL